MMAELIHSAQSFMNAKDATIAKKKKKGERLEAFYNGVSSDLFIHKLYDREP